MSLPDHLLDLVTRQSRIVIAVLLVLTLVIGSGATALEQDTSMDQFETESPEADKLDYIDRNFGIDDDTTTAQVVIQDDNVLDRESLIATLELQQDLRENETVNQTLVDDPFGDISMVIAQTAMIEERQAELENRSAELERQQAELEEDSQQIEQRAAFMSDTLNETVALQAEYDQLNASYEAGEMTDEEYQAESARIEGEFDGLDESAQANLTVEQYTQFAPLVDEAREIQAERFEIEMAFEAGEIDEAEYETRIDEIDAEMSEVYAAIEDDVLADELAELEARGEELEAEGEEIEQGFDELGEIDPTTGEAIEQLESMNETEIEDTVASTLDEDANEGLFVFLPRDYEPGSTQADARMVFVTQETPGEVVQGEAPDEIRDSQLAMAEVVDDRFDDGFVFGAGIISDEIDRSLGDSLAIVLPLALLFVTVVLVVAYRDLLDIVIGLFGIVVVLVWTFGFMGWADIAFNVIMIAVPVLLVGLSVDYAIHVFMRHRERRGEVSGDTRRAMAVALAGVGLALIWVTGTAVIGFLSNLVSPVAPIREFGVTSAFGIASALLIFGILVPAIKLELDALFEARGFDREKRAFGTGGGAFTAFLSQGRRAAGRAPWVVVLIALLITGVGVVGATQVDTTFEEEDFIADDPPEWMKHLPEPFAPGSYSVKENLDYVNEQFLRQDTQTQVLIEGDVTDDRTLERIDEAEGVAAEKDTTVVLASGGADVRSPLSTMEQVAAANETFNETFTAADTTGDGVPDEDVEGVYDALFEADSDAAGDVIYRTADGEYESVRMIISVEGGATAGEATADTRNVASSIDGDGLAATATGQLVVYYVIEQELFDTVIESLLVTLVAVFAFLMIGYRWRHGSAALGAITLLPIIFAVAWILGTMYLLDVPFNVMTGTITSLTVGLGIAYNIHMSERYVLERRRGADVTEALHRSVTGTGGALLGSAATTIGGFGVLVFAILPPLQQFGLITSLTILYAFLGSVFVLPSMLVLWTQYLGPPGVGAPGPESAPDEPTPAVEANGGEAVGDRD